MPNPLMRSLRENTAEGDLENMDPEERERSCAIGASIMSGSEMNIGGPGIKGSDEGTVYRRCESVGGLIGKAGLAGNVWRAGACRGSWSVIQLVFIGQHKREEEWRTENTRRPGTFICCRAVIVPRVKAPSTHVRLAKRLSRRRPFRCSHK